MIFNAMLIVPPTIYVLAFTSTRLLGVWWGLAFDIIPLVSMLNLLRLIYKCGYTEPGIIPAIPTEDLDASKTYSK